MLLKSEAVKLSVSTKHIGFQHKCDGALRGAWLHSTKGTHNTQPNYFWHVPQQYSYSKAWFATCFRKVARTLRNKASLVCCVFLRPRAESLQNSAPGYNPGGQTKGAKQTKGL